MRRGAWRWFALISTIIVTAHLDAAGRRPSYGGDLRVSSSGQLAKLDPTSTPVNATDAALRLRLLPLVFEGLVKLNDRGLPEPVLAELWTSSPDFRRWTFSVRPGVRFHDGSPVTASVLVDCLTTVENPFVVHEYEGKIVIEAADPMPDLLQDLATPERAVSRTTSENVPVGTGPFRILQWDPGKRAVLAAFDEHWGGRPFVDRILLEMGQPARNQWMELELGRQDLIEVPIEEVRNTVQRGYRVLTSRPLELMALLFSSPATGSQELNLRRALALAIDRDSILRVLLQRQGEATGSLLPQWITGYSFLFASSRDLNRARSLLPPLSREPELALGYPEADRLSRSVSERLALDVQAAGIRLRPVPLQNGTSDSSTPNVTLVRLPIGALDEKHALMSLAGRFDLQLPNQTDWTQLESSFKAERELLKDLQVIPLFHLPTCYAVGLHVRYQRPEDVFVTEALHLENVWLENAGNASLRLDSLSECGDLAAALLSPALPANWSLDLPAHPPVLRANSRSPALPANTKRSHGSVPYTYLGFTISGRNQRSWRQPTESRGDEGRVAPGDRTPQGVREPGVWGSTEREPRRGAKNVSVSPSPLNGAPPLVRPLPPVPSPFQGSITGGYAAFVPSGLSWLPRATAGSLARTGGSDMRISAVAWPPHSEKKNQEVR